MVSSAENPERTLKSDFLARVERVLGNLSIFLFFGNLRASNRHNRVQDWQGPPSLNNSGGLMTELGSMQAHADSLAS